MKSTAVKISILLMLALQACAPKITDTWNYTAVYNRSSGASLPVAVGDSLIIKSDGTFAYRLKLAGRSGNGFWRLADTLSGKSLVLCYLPNKSLRSFQLDTFTRKRLVISEGPMVFSYRSAR
jgi:hypothetical protein